ncbi:MAG: MarC family protein [Alphaproteobacteria bacterium]|jgi:multiple antibiotic resistance protein|nr:MarC family protein [Alphaproteobacteria bacterium]
MLLHTYNILDTFLLAFFAFFATVSPLNVLIVFMSSTGKYSSEERKKIAIKSVTVASIVLIIVMFFGVVIFRFLGIEVYSIRTAGGILLLLTAIGMMFGEDKESVDISHTKKDISVFPMAVPIIAGPAGMTTGMLVFQSYTDIILKMTVFAALISNLALTIVLLLLSDKIITKIKKSVLEVFLRIAGLILASLALQFIFNGIREAGIFK